jgi:hypothetical protein
MKKEKNLKQILLICKENLLNFYKNVGFELVGESNVVKF